MRKKSFFWAFFYKHLGRISLDLDGGFEMKLELLKIDEDGGEDGGFETSEEEELPEDEAEGEEEVGGDESGDGEGW